MSETPTTYDNPYSDSPERPPVVPKTPNYYDDSPSPLLPEIPPGGVPYAPESGDWMELKETDPETIDLQMKWGPVVAREYFSFLNNLPDHFPGFPEEVLNAEGKVVTPAARGGRRTGSVMRAMFLANDPVMYGDDAIRRPKEGLDELRRRLHSQQMQETITYKQYRQDIRDAVIEAAADPNSNFTIEGYMQRCTARNNREFNKDRAGLEEYYKYAMPVYKMLRLKGYSHFDLVQ